MRLYNRDKKNLKKIIFYIIKLNCDNIAHIYCDYSKDRLLITDLEREIDHIMINLFP